MASRGHIYDRNGRDLAINTPVYSVFVSPEQVPPVAREEVSAQLANTLAVDKASVLALLASDRKFAYVARRQPREKYDQLRRLKLPGVGMQEEQQRSYLPGAEPDTTLAANLLGFVNDDGAGQYGVEHFYNDRLAGKAGFVSTYTDLANREIVLGTRSHRDAVNGADLTLSLDSDVQFVAEQALAAGVKGAKAESGSVLIMDPSTGGIIAWADYPTYNANNFASTPVDRFIDPAVSHLYEPGSVMKVVTLSGALDVHAITPGTTINDPGVIGVDGFTIRDWDLKNHGTVTMTNVLEKSLNVGAIRAMQMEGAANYYRYLQGFGFGGASGVDVAGESAVPLPPAERWHASDFATASFGQGIDVNMVQMLSAVNVVANKGKLAAPHVVDRVGGKPVVAPGAPQRQVIAPETAQLMTRMMESVVQNGSGYTARVPGFEKDEAGKTGTSQIPVNGQYTWDVWASYVGFLPADNPRFTMLVVVRKPNNGSFDHNEGYYVSAPIWKQIAQAMVLQWRITPDPGH
jgi:stage V sporulation protein D (sporulation-specific penicillin-binding protein)